MSPHPALPFRSRHRQTTRALNTKLARYSACLTANHELRKLTQRRRRGLTSVSHAVKQWRGGSMEVLRTASCMLERKGGYTPAEQTVAIDRENRGALATLES